MKLDELIEELVKVSQQGYGEAEVEDCTQQPVEAVYILDKGSIRIV